MGVKKLISCWILAGSLAVETPAKMQSDYKNLNIDPRSSRHLYSSIPSEYYDDDDEKRKMIMTMKMMLKR